MFEFRPMTYQEFLMTQYYAMAATIVAIFVGGVTIATVASAIRATIHHFTRGKHDK